MTASAAGQARCNVMLERLLARAGWTLENLGDRLRYVPADDELDQPWNPTGAVAALASVVDADFMERRHFVALTAVAHQWLFDPARVAASVLGKRVDMPS